MTMGLMKSRVGPTDSGERIPHTSSIKSAGIYFNNEHINVKLQELIILTGFPVDPPFVLPPPVSYGAS